MEDDLLSIFGDGDPARATEKYEYLFRYFCRYFEWRGCENPEDLAQTVFERGIERIRGGSTVWSAGIGGFLYGFARNIVQEQRKATRRILVDSVDRSVLVTPHMSSIELTVLIGQYLEQLDEEERTVLLDYVNGKRSQAGESPQALRIRIHRIREKLRTLAAIRTKSATAE